MNESNKDTSKGVFDPAAVKDLAEALEKAEERIAGTGSEAAAGLDRERLARRIVSEARAGGTTKPDVVSRAAADKALHETGADLPLAGPHASESNTEADATPGAGALPAEQPGDDVDPGTG